MLRRLALIQAARASAARATTYDVAVARDNTLCFQTTGVLRLVARHEPPGGRDHPPPREELTAVGEQATHGARSAGIAGLLGDLPVGSDLARPETVQRGADALGEVLPHRATVATYVFAASGASLASEPYDRWGPMAETPARSRKAEQSEATRSALVASARELFATKGFAETSTEEIVQRAQVTRGALYHHYRDKEDLFRAVVEEIEEELARRTLEAAMRGSTPLERIQLGFADYLDACLEPVFEPVEDGLRQAIDAAEIDDQPTDTLAHLLFGAASQAALVVARASRPRKARANAGASLHRLIEGLRVGR